MHNNVMNDALNIDVGRFCEDVISSCENWLAAFAADPTVQQNLTDSMQRYPQGLAPYIVGFPVIA